MGMMVMEVEKRCEARFLVVFIRAIFFFQAEDGIRGYKVTGVQTCALPIWGGRHVRSGSVVYRRDGGRPDVERRVGALPNVHEIGRASCRERV